MYIIALSLVRMMIRMFSFMCVYVHTCDLTVCVCVLLTFVGGLGGGLGSGLGGGYQQSQQQGNLLANKLGGGGLSQVRVCVYTYVHACAYVC